MYSPEQIFVYFAIGLVVLRYCVGLLQDTHRSLLQIAFLKKLRQQSVKHRPRLTIVLVGQSEQTITRSLAQASELAAGGKNISVLYIDNASNDDTVKKARAFAANNSLITVLAARRPLNTNQILQRSKRYAKGSLVLLVPCGAKITEMLLRRIQRIFALKRALAWAPMQYQLSSPVSNAGVLQLFSQLSQYRYSRPFSTSEHFMVVRKRLIKSTGSFDFARSNSALALQYPLVVSISEWATKHSAIMPLLRFKGGDSAVGLGGKLYHAWARILYKIEPFVYAYAIWLSLSQIVYEPLLVAYALVTGLYVYSLVTHSWYSFLTKAKLSLYIPILFLTEIMYGVIFWPLTKAVKLIRHTRNKLRQATIFKARSAN